MRLLISRSGIYIRNLEIVLVDFLLRRTGNLVEIVAALLVASVSKITSGHGAEQERDTYKDSTNFYSGVFLIFSIFHFVLPEPFFLHFPRLCLRSAASPQYESAQDYFVLLMFFIVQTACWFVFVTVLFNLMIYLARWYWEKLQHAINAEHHPIIHDTTTAL